MANVIKYKGVLYQRVDEVGAKEIIVRLSKEAIKINEKARETAKTAEKLSHNMAEALTAIDKNDNKKALEYLQLAERCNGNSINGSSLITGIVHAIKALQ